ncbi:MAG TPA: hypothetical protein VFG42_20125 [Baekduia sp.]|uniref:NAD(P)H-dependent amine dehydrogenase family protein n=1 Tax=Baekduia sp. TaxID=2600305 RepID=UPI002D7747E8|nr:hypothetical protein [Baekduia sp.]HET6509113.1 hypothetical protein [Baekduia sp.]
MSAAEPRPVRVVVYGVGEMGLLLTRMLVDKGATVAGAVGRSPAKVGRDLGELAGLGRDLGVRVTDDPEALLARCDADVAVMAVSSSIAAMASHFRVCLAHGVDVITLEEECFHPWRSSPSLAADLDALARDRGATLMASGMQDVFWSRLPVSLMASAHVIRRVRGRSTWRADEYGPEVAEHLHIGGDPAAATAALPGEWGPMVGRSALEALAALAGLTPTGFEGRLAPVVAATEIRSQSLEVTIPPGAVSGVSEIVRVPTAEGIDLELEMSGLVLAPDERPVNAWWIDGEPSLQLLNDDFPGRMVTCATVVNRVPDVLAAPPGLVTVDRLPPPRFRPGPLLRPR